MNKRILALIAGLGLAAAACKDSTSVTDLNNVSSDALNAGLTRSSTALLVSGLMNSTRGDMSESFLVFSETMGRDTYRMDNAEPRWITETVGGPADFTDFVGGGVFGQFYTSLRSANTVLNALSGASGLSVQEKSATQGIVNVMKAIAYWRALSMRDSLGIAFDVNHPIDDPPAHFLCKPDVLASISVLLDSAVTELNAGGPAFPFALPGGFALNGDFTTPAAMVKFAKGLQGKIELYRGLSHQKPNTASFASAIADINASFASGGADMNMGIYNIYSTAAGETTYPQADANIYLNPFVGDSIQAGDLRSSKITVVTSRSLNGVTSKYKTPLTDPSNLTRPLAILKNSELLLIRAQAYIENGDLVSATTDINAVRTKDGGLPAIAVPASKAAAITAVLYEKRYSLLAEGPQRLVDLRAYGRLNASAGPGTPNDIFQSALPIPKTQLDTRNVTSITPDCP